ARVRRPLVEESHRSRERVAIGRRSAAPIGVPSIEAFQLDAQEGCLETVEPLVEAGHDVLALTPLSDVPQPADTLGELAVIGRDRAPVPQRSEVLARIEAERSGIPKRTRPAPRVDRPVRL